MQSQTKVCNNCKNQFVIEPDDFGFYEKIKVPPPTWCPDCRFQRRLAAMNDRELYKRTCALCGKNIIAMYSPESKAIVYCNSCWWSDKWDGAEYARDYDPTRPFLEQVKELYHATPQMALELNYPTLVNSDYINHAATAKNCYLIWLADECENVLYSEYLLHNKDSMDGTMYSYSELSYGLITCGKCFRVFFSEHCENCTDVYFSRDCLGCSNCFGCVGLRNKQYHIFNQPYSKEEYKKKLQEFNIASYRNLQEFKQKARSFWRTFPHRFAHMLRNVNVTGEYVYESKNSKELYDVSGGVEDSRFCQIITMPGTKDAYDYTLWGNNAQRIYECMIAGEGADNVRFSQGVWPNVRDVEYSMVTLSSSHMLGCANIRNKQYSILNKQYSKEDFEKLRETIIHAMNEKPYKDTLGRVYPYGEFFPAEFSLFGYNETYAASYFPLTRAEAERQGFLWYEGQKNPQATTMKASDLPDEIKDVRDEITKEIIECATCKKPFRFVEMELSLLRRFNLPLPHACVNCRYKERWGQINKFKLYKRNCQCKGSHSENGVYQNTRSHFHNNTSCPNEFETSYELGRKEIVYCEQCYNAEVV